MAIAFDPRSGVTHRLGFLGVSQRRPRAAEADVRFSTFTMFYDRRLRLHTYARTRETRGKFFLPRLVVNEGTTTRIVSARVTWTIANSQINDSHQRKGQKERKKETVLGVAGQFSKEARPYITVLLSTMGREIFCSNSLLSNESSDGRKLQDPRRKRRSRKAREKNFLGEFDVN